MAVDGGIASTLYRLIGIVHPSLNSELVDLESGNFQKERGLQSHVSKRDLGHLPSRIEGEGKPGDEYELRRNIHGRSQPKQTSNAQNRQASPMRLKRKQNTLHGDDSSVDSDNGGRQLKRQRRPQLTDLGEQKHLACPFGKIDPCKYRACLKKKMGKISHIKQHLQRCHTPEFYCQICLSTFTNEVLFDEHINRRSCENNTSSKLDGISTHQIKQLTKRARGSIEQQWFRMWDIVFPTCKRPPSIYFDFDESEEFCQIREFIQQKGGDIFLGAMQASEHIAKSGIPQEQLQECFQQGMDLIFEHYRTNHLSRSSMRIRAGRSVAPDKYPTRDSPWPPQQETPARSSVDSAVVLHGADESGATSGKNSMSSSFITADTKSPTRSLHDDGLKTMELITTQPLLDSSKTASRTVDHTLFIDDGSIFGVADFGDRIVPPLQKIISDPRLLGLVPENQGRVLPNLDKTTGPLSNCGGKVELEQTLGWEPFEDYGLFLQ